MSDIFFIKMSVSELLRMHSEIINELRERGILRSQNNPVADYTEWLVSKKLDLSLSPKSQSGFDATNTNGDRYQIKGRRLTPQNKSTQLGVIRNLSERKFDFLVGVILNSDYSVNYAAQIPYGLVSRLSVYSEHQNGNILHLRKGVLNEKEVEDITEKLCV